MLKRLQEFLKRLGFFPDISTTYYYGPITFDSVKKFQLDKGIIISKDDPPGEEDPKLVAL